LNGPINREKESGSLDCHILKTATGPSWVFFLHDQRWPEPVIGWPVFLGGAARAVHAGFQHQGGGGWSLADLITTR
jgi:hypothetical protein